MKKRNNRYAGAISNQDSADIYLSIDHLSDGNYRIHFMVKEEIVKTVYLRKSND